MLRPSTAGSLLKTETEKTFDQRSLYTCIQQNTVIGRFMLIAKLDWSTNIMLLLHEKEKRLRLQKFMLVKLTRVAIAEAKCYMTVYSEMRFITMLQCSTRTRSHKSSYYQPVPGSRQLGKSEKEREKKRGSPPLFFLSLSLFSLPTTESLEQANLLMTAFLMIFRRFPTTFRRFPKIFQNCSEYQTNVPEHFPKFSENFRRCPKISEDFRGRPEDVSMIHQRI